MRIDSVARELAETAPLVPSAPILLLLKLACKLADARACFFANMR
jgi:hypothetical protein